MNRRVGHSIPTRRRNIEYKIFPFVTVQVWHEEPGPILYLHTRLFCIECWDGLSRLSALWDSLSSVPNVWLGRCTLGWFVWPVVDYPLLGVHPSISIVKLTVIGYCCNCLDGQLNYWAFTHWLISVTIMY